LLSAGIEGYGMNSKHFISSHYDASEGTLNTHLAKEHTYSCLCTCFTSGCRIRSCWTAIRITKGKFPLKHPAEARVHKEVRKEY
jgi:hypothetical protein